MMIMTLDGCGIMNSDWMDDIYLVEPREYGTYAVRCRYSNNGKDLTLGTYPTKRQAITAMEVLLEAFRLGKPAIKMPTEEEAALRYEPDSKQRSANGKKTVRRGGS